MTRMSVPSPNFNSNCTRIHSTGRVAILLALLVIFTAGLHAQTFVPINYPGSIATEAHGINAFGQIVGDWTDSSNRTHAFLFDAGTFTSFDYPGTTQGTIAYSINNAGEIVGLYNLGTPFLLKNGVFTSFGGGYDINNFEFTASGAGFMDSSGNNYPVKVPGAVQTTTYGISDAFEVVGDFWDGSRTHGFSFNQTSYSTIDFPGSTQTVCQGVNTLGEIVGYFLDTSGAQHGFLLTGGNFTQIDFPGATTLNYAFHANDFDQVVGRTAVSGKLNGFLRNPASRNPVPHINEAIVPNTSAPGGPGFTLTVNGTGFVSGAVVNWNGSALPTSFQSDEQMTATVNASKVAIAGTALVTVTNPVPGGGTSNPQFFSITNPTSGQNFSQTTVTAGASPQRNIAADFNRDGIMDLAAADGPNNKIWVALGNGDGSFQSAVSYTVGNNPTSLIAADFDNDGKVDIAVADNDGGIYVLQGNGDGTFHVDPIISVAGAGPWDLAVGDFNGDGRLDLACINQTGNTISIFLGNGNATFNGEGFFQPPASIPTNPGPGQITVGDFNGDGILDLAVANFGGFVGDTVSVFIGKGNGTFQPKVDYNTSLAPLSVVAADFNGDGKLDLAVANSCGSSSPCGRPGSVSILLGNGDGTFQSHTDYPAGSFPYTIIAGDFNGDGKLDVAVSDLDSLQVTILFGVGDGTFQNSSVLSTSASPVGLLAADFNRDGYMDFAVGSGSGIEIMLQTAAAVTITPSSLSFGNEAIFTTSASKTVTLKNAGTAILTINSIASSTDFAISSTTCGPTLAPGASCRVIVTFTPSVLGSRTGTLTFIDSASGSPQTISLSGTGVAQVTLSPASLTFAKRAIQTTSAAKVITLTNNLPTVLTINSISFTGTNPGDFAQTNTCGSSVAGKAKCTISVTFTPQATGTRTAVLNISDGANNSPQTVSLTGTAVAQVTWTPASLTFALQNVGTTSGAKVVTLTNNLPTILTLSTITFTGTNPGDFAVQTTTCGSSLGSLAKCTISVTFTPQFVGTRTATLNVSDSANNSPQTVSLKGTGR